jgi:hypothetical protein
MSEHIEYQVISEDFNEYKIENGQVLKFKRILADLVSEKENDKPQTRLGLKDLSHVYNTVDIDTTGFDESTPELVTEKDQIRELKFEVSKENVSIYETAKSLILVSSSVNKVYLTNKKGKTNSPILRYESPSTIVILDKKTLQTPANP